MPVGVGQQVAQAAQQLDQAGKALEQMQFQGAPGDGNEQGQQGEGEGEGEGQGSQAGSESGQESAADALKQAAQSMRQAAEKAGANQQGQGKGQGQGQKQGQPSNQGAPGNQSSDFGNDGEAAASANNMDLDLEGFTGRNWGELPGTLKSDLLESSRRTTDGDYSRLVRRYFQDISKSRQPQLNSPQLKK